MKSNPEGVCEAQDLRGDSKILFEIPTLRVALRVRLAIKLLAQDDAGEPNADAKSDVTKKQYHSISV